jgi:multidrug resistance efflux pump
VLSTVELENARAKEVRAAANYREAAANLERARYRLRVSALRAPFAARVLSSSAEIGQAVAAQLAPPVLMVIAADGEYLARARLTPERATRLQPGQALQVSAGGKTYAAQVRALSNDPAGGKEPYLLDVVFVTTDTLHAGQGARIELP